MRLSGWLVGIIAFGFLALVTALCSVFSYGAARQVVIDLGASGLQMESPLEVARCVVARDCGVAVAANATLPPTADVRVVLASPTPLATLALENPQQTTNPDTPIVIPTSDPDALAGIKPDILKDPRQIRILLLGIDQRSAIEEPGPFRTDTMILVNIDPVRKTVGVISIPRDLWVEIPGFTYGRINTANALGDANAYPGGGGPALAAETVAKTIGIRVDKYILVNFDVFTTVVDAIAPNGVEVCVRERIDDPHYPDAGYGTIRVTFEPGCQRLNSERLLQYARTRATQGGDFDRARRQQEVLDAVLKEVISAGGISNFIGQAGVLWEELSGSFRTNLTLEDLIGIGIILSQLDRDDVHYAVIDNNYVDLGTTPDGTQEILIPQQARISDLVQRVFFPQNELSAADLKARADLEAASIVVFNGTDIPGLANATREYLTARGVSIAEVGNIPTPTNADTIIKDYTNNPWTARYLALLLDIPIERIQPGTDGMTAKDVMVVAGPDLQAKLSGGN